MGGPCLLKLSIMGTQRVYKCKKSFLGWFVGLDVTVQEIFVLSWLLYSAQNKNKIFCSSPYTLSILLSSSPSKLGGQPCWVACLLVCRELAQHGGPPGWLEEIIDPTGVTLYVMDGPYRLPGHFSWIFITSFRKDLSFRKYTV
jgi:hypothetical protein